MLVCGLWSNWPLALGGVTSEKEKMSSSTVLALGVTALAVLLWFFRSFKKQMKHSASAATLPPGPRGLPLLGYLPFLGPDLHTKFTELSGVYGPIYKLWLGNKLCVVVSSPSLAKEVVRDNDIVFADRNPPIAARVMVYGANDIAFSSYGPEWKKLRKVFVREMLSNANLDASYALRKQEVKKAIRNLYHNEVDNPIDFGELAFKTVINAIIRILLGGGSLQEEKGTGLVEQFRSLVAEIMMLLGKPNVSDLIPALARFDLQGIKRHSKRVSLDIDQFLEAAIEQRSNLVTVADKAQNGENKDILQILLELNKLEDPKRSITSNQLKAILLDILSGGTDTTATMIEWTMAELMQHQEVREKVCQELKEVVGLNNVVEEFHLPKLRYLDAVIKEAFRLHPALPLLVPRYSTQACKLGGYTIPKGTTLFLNVYALHRDPNLWDNPLEFKPERFLNDPDINRFDYSGNNFQFLPFGSGRRICAGLPLAEKMLMYVLASLLHSFEWKLPVGAEMDFSGKFGIVVKKMKPLMVIPTPRLSNLELYYRL